MNKAAFAEGFLLHVKFKLKLKFNNSIHNHQSGNKQFLYPNSGYYQFVELINEEPAWNLSCNYEARLPSCNCGLETMLHLQMQRENAILSSRFSSFL